MDAQERAEEMQRSIEKVFVIDREIARKKVIEHFDDSNEKKDCDNTHDHEGHR